MLKLKRLARGLVPPYLILRHQAMAQLQQGERELALVELICDRTAIAVDVGASIGVYTYFAARHSAHVYALEPAPDAAATLRRSVPANVTVLPIAASDVNGRFRLYVPKVGSATINSRASLEADANPGFELVVAEVEARRLDDCGFANVAFLKIDVEGHEHAVLAGGHRLISAYRPAILIESEERHRRGAVRETTETLGQFGYRGFFLHEGHLRPVTSFVPAVHQRPENTRRAWQNRGPLYINNFLFIHESRRDLMGAITNRFPLAA